MTEFEIAAQERNKKQLQERKSLLQELHEALFSEAYDYYYDSTADAKDRRRGINPMSESYTEKVNAKRASLGVSLLGNDGLEIDDSAHRYCHAITENLDNGEIKALIAKHK